MAPPWALEEVTPISCKSFKKTTGLPGVDFGPSLMHIDDSLRIESSFW
jgi:hypothetical protein